MTNTRSFALVLLLVAAVIGATYSNHFQNDFHFDDWHTVQENPSIRNLSNLPKFFTDGSTMSSLPANRSYRPLLVTSLALDYKLGNGLNPVYFHLSTFAAYAVQLVLIFFLFLQLMNRARPDASSRYLAAFATALFGLHPASAETVNYVVQRADLYVALFLVASLAAYMSFPGLRRWGFHLLPIVPAMLFKPTAIMIAPIFMAYELVFGADGWRAALRRSAPVYVVSAALLVLVSFMTPSTHTPGGGPLLNYLMTQPRVALHYFTSFFLPIWLSVDTDRKPVDNLMSETALIGYGFLLIVLYAAFRASRKPEWKPIGFGLWWFLIALVPTAVVPLAEVENDHRMFAAFIGLALAATWAGYLFLESLRSSAARPAAACAAVVLLLLCANATYARNEVWKTEESLWLDATIKSPRNGRAHMNYGLTQMKKGDYAKTLAAFNTAKQFTPNYPILEINLGILKGAMKQSGEAEAHFQRAIALAPQDPMPRQYYDRWLKSEALAKAQAEAQIQAHAKPSAGPTPESLLQLSLVHHQARRYQECIKVARQALRLRPGFVEAYNNIAAGYEGLAMWDEAIDAAQQALRLRPDYVLARNNLLYSQSQKAKAQNQSGQSD